MDVEKIKRILRLKPLDFEGGYFAETYRSKETFDYRDATGAKKKKSLCTAIYYLITPETSSMIHSLSSDEIFHFYLGDPVRMLVLYPDGSSHTIVLGKDLSSGQKLQYVVPKNSWQGSYLLEGGRFALMGTTVSPAFDYEDFILGEREFLLKKYPDRKDIITRLTTG